MQYILRWGASVQPLAKYVYLSKLWLSKPNPRFCKARGYFNQNSEENAKARTCFHENTSEQLRRRNRSNNSLNGLFLFQASSGSTGTNNLKYWPINNPFW